MMTTLPGSLEILVGKYSEKKKVAADTVKLDILHNLNIGLLRALKHDNFMNIDINTY